MTLSINPLAEVRPERDGEEIVALSIWAPVRGRGLQVTTFNKADDVESFRRLRRALLPLLWDAGSASPSDCPPDVRDRLSRAGVLVTPEETPRAVQFACPLEPSTLVPAVSRRAAETLSARTHVVNSTLRVTSDASGLSASARDAGAGARAPRLRLEYPATNVTCMYVLRAPDVDEIDRLRCGALDPGALSADRVATLEHAGVLLSAERSDARQGMLAAARRQFADRGFAIVRDIVPPLQVAALRRYYRERFEQGFVRWEDQDGNRGYFAHNDARARDWHLELATLVRTVVGEPLTPSFAYLFGYRPGAYLAPHVDREQCELTISWQVDFEPDPDDVAPWPLYVEPAGSTSAPVAVHLAPGEALIFRGRELRHSRDPLPNGQRSTTITFCYVKADFTGSLE